MDETYEESARRLERDHHDALSRLTSPGLRGAGVEVPVHNQVYPRWPDLPRHWGSRWWTQAPDGGLEECPCDWAPEHGVHYRVAGVPVRGRVPLRGRGDLAPGWLRLWRRGR